MAGTQKSEASFVQSESQFINRIISEELNERDVDYQRSSLQRQQNMRDDGTMNTSLSVEAEGISLPIYKHKQYFNIYINKYKQYFNIYMLKWTCFVDKIPNITFFVRMEMYYY